MTSLAPTDAILVTACRCGWQYPRELYLARKRTTTAPPDSTVSSDDLLSLLERVGGITVFFSCPQCTTEVFADIAPAKPRVIPVAKG